MIVASRSGRKTGINYVDSTAQPVCYNRRIARHEVSMLFIRLIGTTHRRSAQFHLAE
jgi:hypothetical protein